MNLTTATPAEIDTELARLYAEELQIQAKLTSALTSVHYAAGDKKGYRGSRAAWLMSDNEALAKAAEVAESTAMAHVVESARKALADFDTVHEAIAANEAATGNLDAEYLSRGGWTRAFLVVSNGTGHVHRSMHCSTCYPTTVFNWLPEFSGKDEAEIVEAAGERACTVCYPSAPVDVLKRPSRIFSEDELAAQAAREQRAADKLKRDADKLAKAITPDGSELRIKDGYGSTERFKTERAATTWLVQSIGGHRAFGYKASPEAERTVIEAIAAKHGKNVSTVEAEIEVKVIQWIKRNA